MVAHVFAERTTTASDLRRAVGQGTSWVSSWFTVAREAIDGYCAATGDQQPIHVDDDAAARTPLGGTIAPGFLTLGLLPPMLEDAMPPQPGVRLRLDYGFDKVRFRAPVPTGSRVRGRFVLTHLHDETPDEQTLTFSVSVEVEGHLKPALVATWIIRQYLEPQR